MKNLIALFAALLCLTASTPSHAQGTVSVSNLQVESAKVKPYSSTLSVTISGTATNTTQQEIHSLNLRLTVSQGYQSSSSSSTVLVFLPTGGSSTFTEEFSVSLSPFYSGLDLLKKIDYSVQIESVY